MKRFVLLVIFALLVAIALTGCGRHALEVTLAPTPSPAVSALPSASLQTAGPTVSTPTPDATVSPESTTEASPASSVTATPIPAAQPDVYAIDGSKLYRQSGQGNILAYDAAAYFTKGWDCVLGNLAAEGGELYFSEAGWLQDSDDPEEYVYRIIRFDSTGRIVLREDNLIGYTQLIPYGVRIMFVQDGFDSQEIGWVNKDGSASAYLDFSDYAAQYGVEPYYNGATIYMKDGALFADIAFFTDGDPEIVDHTVSISEDLEITRVN